MFSEPFFFLKNLGLLASYTAKLLQLEALFWLEGHQKEAVFKSNQIVKRVRKLDEQKLTMLLVSNLEYHHLRHNKSFRDSQ